MNAPISVPPENVKFGTCSMESDKYITVCENVGGVQQIAIIDMTIKLISFGTLYKILSPDKFYELIGHNE